MIIDDSNVEKMLPINRINDNIIYMGDIEGEIVKKSVSLKRRIIKRKIRKFNIKAQVFCKRELNDQNNYLHNMLRYKFEVKKDEILEIKKVTLIKELTCSFV